MPVPAGGMLVDRVDEMVSDFGPDTMLLIGGGLLSAGDKTVALVLSGGNAQFNVAAA